MLYLLLDDKYFKQQNVTYFPFEMIIFFKHLQKRIKTACKCGLGRGATQKQWQNKQQQLQQYWCYSKIT